MNLNLLFSFTSSFFTSHFSIYLKSVFYLLIGFFLLPTVVHTQVVGGNNIYEFLNLSASARITALGEHLITVRDDDVNLASSNPSVLNPSMHHQIAFNHNFHLADVAHGNVSFGQHVEKWDMTFHGGLQYVSYGTFDETNVIGEVIGSFEAAENAIVIGAGKQLYERMSVGANLKFITSRFETYNSIGLAGDVAVMIHDTANQVNFTIVAKNIGTQLTTYTDGNREPIPFEMQMGISKRLRHLPFRFSIIYRYLNRWNILYDDPNSVEDTFFFGENTTTGSNDFIDNVFRHFVFSGEFLFGKLDNFRIRFGYNHLRKKELSVRNIRSLTGFSLGLGIKINRFRISFGHSFFHLAGGQNHFSISTNFQEFKKKNRRKG